MVPPVLANLHQQALAPSSAFLYPFKGIYYFATHRYLWPFLRARLIPAIILSILVFATLFTWTYLPQVAFLAIFHGHGAWLNATFLVLGEGAAITALLFEAFFIDSTQAAAFDAVLLAHGHPRLVSVARPIDPDTALNPRQRLGKPTRNIEFAPFSIRQIVEFILLLPLTLVPWAGVPLFLWGTGYRAGPLLHHRYFILRGFSKSQKKDWVRSRRNQYTGFGTVALALQLIPVLSMVFLLTSAAGAALWAAALEDQRLRDEGGEESGDGAQAVLPQADLPPPYEAYEDDPI